MALPKQKGELTTIEVAKALGVSDVTVRNWAHKIWDDERLVRPRGARAELSYCRRDTSGFFYFSRAEVVAVRASSESFRAAHFDRNEVID